MTKQVTRHLDKKIEWQTVVNVKSSVLFMSLNAWGLERKYIKSTLDIDYEFNTFYHFDNTIAYSSKELETLFNKIAQKINKEKNYLFDLPNNTYELANELLDFADNINRKKIGNFSNSKIEKIFKNYLNKCAKAFPLVMVSIPIEIIVTGELEKFVRDRLKIINKTSIFEKTIQELTQYSEKETFFQQDYRQLLRLGVEIQKDRSILELFNNKSSKYVLNFLQTKKNSLYKKLLSHNNEFAWINMYGFRRHPFTIEELVGKLKDILGKNCQKKLGSLERKRIISKEAFYNTIRELDFRGQLKKKVELLPELVYLRTYRFDIFTLSAYKVRNLFSEISLRLGIAIDELLYLTLWEISDLLLNKKDIITIPIKKRMNKHADIMIDGKFEVIVDKKRLNKLYEEKREKDLVTTKTVKGSIASKGKASGFVKVVMHPTQVTKVEKGDVLVAPMTSPDFVIGMLKAVAIVTDHGGITSHAAIVSRELGIPCVVGTKTATRILKDGDFVEVDAEKGMVRKLD